jgi:hypothetical protein
MISARSNLAVSFLVPAMTVSSCWIAGLAVLFDIKAANFDIFINSKKNNSNQRKKNDITSIRP